MIHLVPVGEAHLHSKQACRCAPTITQRTNDRGDYPVAHHHHLKDPHAWKTPHQPPENSSTKSPKWNEPSPTP